MASKSNLQRSKEENTKQGELFHTSIVRVELEKFEKNLHRTVVEEIFFRITKRKSWKERENYQLKKRCF